ncbi:MAG: acetyltransferase [Parcubacteria group bacterium]
MDDAAFKKVNIIGAGSHALVIADILRDMSGYSPASFIEKDELIKDNRKNVAPGLILPIYAQTDFFRDYSPENAVEYLILGLGSGLISIREKLIARLKDSCFVVAIHSSAVIAPSAQIGVGSVVMAGAVLNPYVKIGRHAIINTGATVDHECEIGENTFIQPGAHLAGNVKVGNNSIIGIGANIKEGITVGSNSIVGGGAFVNNDVPDNVVYVGVPAKKLRDNIK